MSASFIGLAFGYWAGLNLVIPVAIFAAAAYAGNRLFPASKNLALPAISFQLGQIGWMCLAVFVPGGLAAVGSDIAIMAALIIWLYISLSRAAAITTIVYNAMSLVVYAYEVFTGSGIGLLAGTGVTATAAKGLSVHIVWRLVTIALLVLFVQTKARNETATRLAEPA